MIVFPGAWVISQEKTERLPRQHLTVDGGDLMWQRVDHRGVDGEARVKQMSEVDPVRFRDQAEQLPVAVKAPRSASFTDFQSGFAILV